MKRFIATILLSFTLAACTSVVQDDPVNRGIEAYRAEDYATARAQWTIASERGDPTGQNNLAYLLYTGRGGPTDAAHAVALWKQAAASGHSEAQLHLGVACAEGRGTEKNLPQGYAWCRCAVATAEGPADTAADSVSAKIASEARHCVSVLQAELNDEQLKQGDQLAEKCLRSQGAVQGEPDGVVDARDPDGRTALMSASARGDGDVVERLLQRGAQPDLRDQAFGMTALMYAAENDRAAAAEQLLRAGAKPDIKDDQGWTALCYAALNIRPSVVVVLLQAHAPVNVQTNDGRSPLIIAAREGNAKTVELLLEAGADPNLQDRGGKTALAWAMSKGNTGVQTLLEARTSH